MIQKKVCMLGGFAVGKTSLVSRYVRSIFSEKYLTTVGVKIDKKELSLGSRAVTLMLWDIYGQDAFQSVQQSYLRGMAGYLLVVDGTRPDTLDAACELQKLAVAEVGDVPFVLVLNKSDLMAEWQVQDKALFKLAQDGWSIVRASAKTGDGVEAVFELLARKMLPE